ncbi:hypothetical protein KKB55_07400 [Myxococcota bacterium]|nr:hypothetical protein [Myxococcota bacterium]MBU1897582.1 hypothetical protein [Myxococcota bacterium]
MSATHQPRCAERLLPGRFEPVRHFYPKVLNAQIHPMVRFFMGLSNERIVERYRHLNPQIDAAALSARLSCEPRHLRWAGCDLMHVTTEIGHRQMTVIETNSCPSGQKSMPLYEEFQEDGGYGILVDRAFKGLLERKRNLPEGGLAVIYDKNEMEASGYAAAIASAMNEPVWLARWDDNDPSPPARFQDRVLEVRDEAGAWHPIRAAMRYVTQRPWNRLPIHTRTQILNPVIVCLAGGRNKMIAAKAYEFFNAKQEFEGSGLIIHTPETYRDVRLNEVPLWVKSLGGRAVVKVPYSNAGQGVYTITSEAELEAFMQVEHHYERFIVQSLVGNYEWSSQSEGRGRLYHVGTIPDKHLNSYVADLRMMVVAGPGGFRPVAIYARRARAPLTTQLSEAHSSWDILGTNLSIKNADGSWGSDTDRLMLMDRKDFNRLGVGLDGLIEAYIQTILSVTAIDELADSLFTKKGRFRKQLFSSLNEDQALIDEILVDGL